MRNCGRWLTVDILKLDLRQCLSKIQFPLSCKISCDVIRERHFVGVISPGVWIKASVWIMPSLNWDFISTLYKQLPGAIFYARYKVLNTVYSVKSRNYFFVCLCGIWFIRDFSYPCDIQLSFRRVKLGFVSCPELILVEYHDIVIINHW
jgi:hypothetical protein